MGAAKPSAARDLAQAATVAPTGDANLPADFVDPWKVVLMQNDLPAGFQPLDDLCTPAIVEANRLMMASEYENGMFWYVDPRGAGWSGVQRRS